MLAMTRSATAAWQAFDEALKKGSIEAELLGHLGAHNRSELLGIARQNNDGLAGRGRESRESADSLGLDRMPRLVDEHVLF